MNLESRIEDALEGSGCSIKQNNSPISVTLRGNSREFIHAILEFNGSELEGYIDVSLQPSDFGRGLLVNRSGFVIDMLPCKMAGLLYSSYSFAGGVGYEDTENEEEANISGIYFPDIPLDIIFPSGYKFHSASNTYFEAINNDGKLLRYTTSSIKEKETEMTLQREGSKNQVKGSKIIPESV